MEGLSSLSQLPGRHAQGQTAPGVDAAGSSRAAAHQATSGSSLQCDMDWSWYGASGGAIGWQFLSMVKDSRPTYAAAMPLRSHSATAMQPKFLEPPS